METAPEIIKVLTHEDGIHAVCIDAYNEGKKYKIQEIMLGAGFHRKAIKYSKLFIDPNSECKAEVLNNGKLRII